MATKKGGGSTKNGRDSNPNFLGLKVFGNQYIKQGNIILTQYGLKLKPGLNVKKGKNATLYALKSGILTFKKINTNIQFVNIL